MKHTHLLVSPSGEVFTAGSEDTCKLSLRLSPFCKIIKMEDATEGMLEGYRLLEENAMDLVWSYPKIPIKAI